MDERDDRDSERGTAGDDANPGEGSLGSGELLAKRLAEATRDVSRVDERIRAEEAALTSEFARSYIAATLPDELPDFIGSEHEVCLMAEL